MLLQNTNMRKLLFTLGFLLSSFFLFAQQSYNIQVVDSKTGKLVANASVKIKSSGKGISTNVNGSAVLQASAGDVLEISSIGYANQELRLSAQSNINVSLEPASIEYLDVVIVGTRGAPRAKIETAVPVDVIRINQVGLPTAKMDLTSALNMAAPSFNYNKQTGADGADHVDLGTLRGLGPDQTLVLINGKRRHQTAFVALFGTRGRGNSDRKSVV